MGTKERCCLEAVSPETWRRLGEAVHLSNLNQGGADLSSCPPHLRGKAPSLPLASHPGRNRALGGHSDGGGMLTTSSSWCRIKP